MDDLDRQGLRVEPPRDGPRVGCVSDPASSRCVGCRLSEETRGRSLPGQRLILVTDGIVDRHTEDGGIFGVDGLRHAIESAEAITAAATAMAIQHAVTECWSEPLEDDATVVVLAVE